MGDILSAQCSCGLAGEVMSGPGMMPGVSYRPAYCKTCDRLLSALMEGGEPRCADCGSAPVVIALQEPTDFGGEVPGSPVPCPRCGKASLRFEYSGLWD